MIDKKFVEMKNDAVKTLASDLLLAEDGIWKNRQLGPVSYPDNGSQQCFQLEDDSFWFKHRNNCIVAAMNLFPPEGTILDIGGGNGFVTRRLLDEGFDSLLLEPFLTGCVNAKKLRKIPQVICSRFEYAGFLPNSFNAIGLFDVLEHISDDKGFMEMVFSILKPNGIIYITVPAFQGLWSRSDIDAQHFRRYNKASIYNLFCTNFNIIYFTYFFRALTLPLFLLRTIPFRLKILKHGNVLSSDSEHKVKSGIFSYIIEKYLALEVKNISSGSSMAFGTSCLIVAQKKNSSQN